MHPPTHPLSLSLSLSLSLAHTHGIARARTHTHTHTHTNGHTEPDTEQRQKLDGCTNRQHTTPHTDPKQLTHQYCQNLLLTFCSSTKSRPEQGALERYEDYSRSRLLNDNALLRVSRTRPGRSVIAEGEKLWVGATIFRRPFLTDHNRPDVVINGRKRCLILHVSPSEDGVQRLSVTPRGGGRLYFRSL